MNKKIFNWGIIGPGKIAHKFAQGVDIIKDSTILAVASRSKNRADDFAKQYGIGRIYTSYTEIVKDPEIDAIYIATPHSFHFEQAKLALENGKPVLCEKPLTVNSKQSRELIELARRNKVFLMEALWTRFLPAYSQVRKWLDEKIIGDIKLLTSTFGINFPWNPEDRKFNHNLAGGALLDLGVYSISVSQWVLRKNPNSFSANAHLGKTKVDEMTTVNLDYGDGTFSQFSCNLISKNENDFIIYGTKGYIRIHDMFWGSQKVTLYKDESIITKDCPFKASGFEYQIEEVISCIRNDQLENKIMPLDQSLHNIELMDKIRESIGLKYNFE